MATAVSRDGIASAKDNIFAHHGLRGGKLRVRAVAGRVRGTEESDRWSSQSDGEMKRPRVAANDAECVAQKRHQLAKFSVVEERARISARGTNRGGQIALPGTVVHDAA
jgi:hypothetical protein